MIKAAAALLITLTALLASPASAEESGTDLGLAGCLLGGVGMSRSGHISFASCVNSPYGMYYSLDLGRHWIFASGGEYEFGDGIEIALSDTYVFFNSVSGSSYRASLPPADATSWSPDWKRLSLGTYLVVSGEDLYSVGYSNGERAVLHRKTSTLGESDHALALPNFPDSTYQVHSMAADGSYLFLVASSGTIDTRKAKLFKSAIAQDGGLGSWSEVGFFVDPQVPDIVHGAPNGALYVALNWPRDIYVSTDHGSTFSAVGANTGMGGVGSCFGGSAFLIGTALSKNTGASFSQIQDHISVGGIPHRLFAASCAISADNPNVILMSGTAGGLLRSENFLSATPSWATALSGLKSAYVTDVAQMPNNKDRVVVATESGLAYTDNFTSPSRTWLYLSCPDSNLNEGCVPSGPVLDPDGLPIVYAYASWMSGVFKGTIHDGVVDWVSFDAGGTLLRSYSFLPGKLAVTQTDGLSFRKTSDGSLVEGSPYLAGQNIADFIALPPAGEKESVYFAAVAEKSGGSVTLKAARSSDSGQNWEIAPLPAGVITAPPYNRIPGTFRELKGLHYNEPSDTLYYVVHDIYGTVSGPIITLLYRLPQARAGGGSWEKVSPVGLSTIKAFAASSADSIVYASDLNRVYTSSDQGSTWSVFYTGKTSEIFNVLLYDDLLGGSNAGLQAIRGQGNTSQCSISIKRLKKGRPTRTRTLTLSYNGAAPNARLESKLNGAKKWKLHKSFAVKAAQTSVKFKVRAPMKVRVRATGCLTKAKSVAP